MLMEKIIYEYSLLRYVPDIERGEFLNIGLMMMCKRRRWMRVGLHIDEGKIKLLWPQADVERLRVQSEVFLRDDVPFADNPVEERYRWMAAVKSAIIQTSPSHPGIIPLPDDVKPDKQLEETFSRLFNRLVNS